MPVFGGDALRVELHAMDVLGLVLQPHDQAIRLGGHLKAVWKTVSLDDQGVIARCGKILRQCP